MRRSIVILSIVVFALTLSGQSKGKGKGNPSENSGARGAPVSVSIIFGDSDRRIIQRWVRDVPPTQLPPGLAKRNELSPGLQKQLRRNGTLPPGLQKKISPFPRDLASRLGPLPPGCGCDRVFLDGRALIIARATSGILDAFNLF